jgi:transcriptional regulator with XRE-family HTH domain
MNLADKLRMLRSRSKLSMSQVARLSEKAADKRGVITQGYISRLESGKETNPSLMKLTSLCCIYKTEPAEFFPKRRGRKPNRK